MSDASATTTTAAADATTTTAASTAGTPWHQGVDPTILGHWQNKGYDLSEPSKVAIEATKSAIEASKMLGVPANELLRMPKANAAEADVKAFWAKLGAPLEAKEYDFSAIKFADGSDLDAAFTDTMRSALASNFVPKEKAASIVQAVVKFMEGAEASDAAEKAAALQTEKATLTKNWGSNADLNRLQAMQGAKRLGVSPEDVALLESQIGYSRVMEMFRKIGAGTSEDTFTEGGQGGTANPVTIGAAKARLDELQADGAWTRRFLDGDVAARREFDALTEQITGVSAAAERAA